MQVTNFPFPSPPEGDALRGAERCLVALSALRPTKHGKQSAAQASLELTPLGHVMATLPLGPRQARMLLEATELAAAEGGDKIVFDVLLHVLGLAAVMSIEAPFVHADVAALRSEGDDGHAKEIKQV
jgi:HrpA-like RNA helicase